MVRKKKSSSELIELSQLEMEIMNIVWNLGECSSAQVIEEVGKSKKLADTTIRTVLSNIRKKGYLEAVPTIERGFHVRPIVPKKDVTLRSLRLLTNTLFSGSPKETVSFIINEEKFDDNDLVDIRQMLELKKAGKNIS